MNRREFLRLTFLGGSALVLPSGLVHAVEVLTPNNPLEYLNGNSILYRLYTNKVTNYIVPNFANKERYSYSLYSGEHKEKLEVLMPNHRIFLKFLQEENIISSLKPEILRDPKTYTLFDKDGNYILSNKVMDHKIKITYNHKDKIFYISKEIPKLAYDFYGIDKFDFNTNFKLLIEIDGEINHIYNIRYKEYADDYLI